MIEPRFSAAIMRRAASWAQNNTASRLVPKTRRHCASSISIARSAWVTPALLTSTVTVPNAASAASNARRIAARSSTSAETATARPPFCPMRSLTAASRSARRATSATAATFAASTSAKRTPSPLEAPVTSATWPVRSNNSAAFMGCPSTGMKRGRHREASFPAVILRREPCKRRASKDGRGVVARAWSNPEYREQLRKDATGAIASMGFAGRQSEHMIAVENTAKIHNMVVCTLCSCYPWAVLGLPPVWYKSAPYRSRAVADPRGVLREFGVELPDETEIRVWDSTAEVRYLVVPMRPAGTEGFSEERLAALVTRDSMIGTGLPKSPAEAP